MMIRLLISLHSAIFCTRFFCLAALVFFGVNSSAQTYKSNAFYEIVIVESVPEGMSLSMSLKEISDAQNTSRVGQTKNNIYEFVNETVSPILNDFATSENKSLLDLAAQLPIDQLISGLVDVNRGKTKQEDITPADFMIVILPKLPESESISAGYSKMGSLYSKKKASVIDLQEDTHSIITPYSDLLNARIAKSVKYMYTRQFVELKQSKPFFVGALFNVHIEGDKTFIKTQLVGSLPTQIKQVFENISDQVHLKHAHSPVSPTPASIEKWSDFPGAVVEFLHKPRQKNLMNLTVSFGSLGLIKDKSWVVHNRLKEPAKGLAGMGINSAAHFNTPHLIGSLQVPEITAKMSFKEKAMAKATEKAAPLYNLKINIHEVLINVNTIEIEKIRVTIDLQPKVDQEKVEQSLAAKKWIPYASPYVHGAGAPPLPALELEFVNEQFTAEGNKTLAPIREKLEKVLGKSPEQLLNDPEIQAEILKFVLSFMKSKQVKVGGVK